MRFIVDTHAWLWLQSEPGRLPASVVDVLEDPANEVFVSAASAWEIAVKHQRGRLVLPEPPVTYVPMRIVDSGCKPLSIEHAHALQAGQLPMHHRDPFDRVLIAWTMPFWAEEIGAFKDEELRAADISLLGRRTYESFAGAWPGRAGDPFADKLNSMRKLVASTTLTDPEWENTAVIEGDLIEAVEAAKAEGGDDILVAGSISVSRALLAANVVDEVRLVQYPVVLSAGRRLFDDAGAHRFDLVDATGTPAGAVLLTYRRSAEPLGKPAFD